MISLYTQTHIPPSVNYRQLPTTGSNVFHSGNSVAEGLSRYGLGMDRSIWTRPFRGYVN